MKPIKNKNSLTSYQIINLIFASIIAGIFIYSAVYSHPKVSHPIPSVFSQVTGKDSPSSGLSRSFSALTQGDVKSAKELNPYSIQIFLFFAFQLIFRILTFFLIKKTFSLINIYILADIALSTLVFLLVFKPLIIFTLELFKNFIVN
ncbi:DUF2752 domain-containing protein [Marinifilum sp. D714]|uniref:DUF2752 domain-containing protein n=1 Tax=Marinifilum sp. D714 TaxID=2937523 RepID=UPI0027C970C3|nr:DUF2752 domain-containing protein [Marinifilum sp. D714]MDQ2180628.1 DUF2752 domain-containing protein [Marinifilum sp. D714]